MLILSDKNRKYDDKLPLHEYYTVIDSRDINKSKFWWSAVVLHTGSTNRKAISLYLWNKKGDKWVRKQKFTIRNKLEFELFSNAVKELLPQLE